jgi:hypothetical protein
MHSQHIRIKPIFLSFVAASAALGISVRVFGGDVSTPAQPKQASFRVRDDFKVQVPKGAKTVRMRFSIPQEDAASAIREFSVTAGFPVRYYRDNWGTGVGYAEVNAPTEGPITIREAFGPTRTETRNDIDPARTRPLTDQERAALFAYLQPSSHMIGTDQIKSLSASIVGGETNPVLAARKIYDWTLENVDYWMGR